MSARQKKLSSSSKTLSKSSTEIRKDHEEKIFEPMTPPYRNYPLLRYAKNFTQHDMKIFMQKFSKERGDHTALTSLLDHIISWRSTKVEHPTPSESSLSLLSIFVACDRLGIYPPPDVLGHLAKGIIQFIKSKGKEPLDEILGIPKISGSRSVFTTQEIEDRNRCYVKTIENLKEVSNLQLKDMCIIAADTCKCTTSLSPKTIENSWNSSKWQKYKEPPLTADDLRSDRVGHDISFKDFDENRKVVKEGKQKNKYKKGRSRTMAILLTSIAVKVASVNYIRIKTGKRTLSAMAHSLEFVNRTIQVDRRIEDHFGYLSQIKKILQNKTNYASKSQQFSALENVIRKALANSKNPFEFPKGRSQVRVFLEEYITLGRS